MGLTEDPPDSGLYAWSNTLNDSLGSIAESVAGLLDRKGCGDDPETDSGVAAAVETITALAKAYTRSRGFTAEGPNADIAAVIVTAAARLISNPRQFTYETHVGQSPRAWRGGFTGWSLAEQAALNRWRVRAQ